MYSTSNNDSLEKAIDSPGQKSRLENDEARFLKSEGRPIRRVFHTASRGPSQ